jgi:predicted HNH restriction endonuclease
MQAGRNNTTRAHAEHRPGHVGCSLGYYFNGVREPYPQQVQPPTKGDALASEQEIVIEDDESAFPEGKEKFRQHRYRERDGKIVQRAKAQRLAETGKLECEVCNIDFDRRYGERGRGFIEAHHKVPVSQLDGKKRTRIEDLALVCSNCHRMLHRGLTLVSVEQLKDELARKCQPIGQPDAA